MPDKIGISYYEVQDIRDSNPVSVIGYMSVNRYSVKSILSSFDASFNGAVLYLVLNTELTSICSKPPE
jgi:hypothetical protein